MASIFGWLFGSTAPTKHRIFLQNPDTYHPYPKDWDPRGYPCIIVTAYNGARLTSRHYPDGLPGLTARADAEGVVLDFSPDRLHVKVGLPRVWDRSSRSASAGWVPASQVMIGTKSKHGKFTSLAQAVQLIHLDPRAVIGDLGLPSGSGLWLQTIAAFLNFCSQERLALPGSSDLFWQNIDAGIPRYALTLESTVGRHDAALCRMLNAGGFLLDDLVENRPTAGDDILKTIPEWVYLIVYKWRFDKRKIMSAKEGKKAAVNVGNSKQPDKRWSSHTSARLNAQPGGPFHYTLAKSADFASMYLLVPVADKESRFIFEQIMQNSLESQAPFCKELEGGAVKVQTYSAQNLMESGKVLSHKLNELVTDSMSMAKKKQAKALYELFKKAKAKTGWIGGCEDPNFYPGGRVIGTNHDQPLFDSRASDVCLSLQRIPGVCSQYKFRPHQVSRRHGNDKELALYLYEQDVVGKKRLFELVLSWRAEDHLPQLGANVVATIERMEGDLTHPAPYARLPTVGCIETWKQASQLGIRFEWQDENGKPCWSYYQRQRVWEWEIKDSQGRTPIGCLQSFLAAEALCRLTDQQFVTNLPEYYAGIRRPLSVLEIKVDHLEQEFGVVSVPRPQAITWPQDEHGQYNLKSQEAVVQELLDAGFPMSSIFDCEFGKIDGKKSMCNRCGLASKKVPTGVGRNRIGTKWYNSTIQREGCKRMPHTNSCKCCYFLGVPCTWHNLDEVMKSEKMMMAIGFTPYHDKAIHGLDDVDISRTSI